MYVHVDDDDALEELSTEQLQAELAKRLKHKADCDPLTSGELNKALLEQAYRDMKFNCPSRALADYFYETLGKIAIAPLGKVA